VPLWNKVFGFVYRQAGIAHKIVGVERQNRRDAMNIHRGDNAGVVVLLAFRTIGFDKPVPL